MSCVKISISQIFFPVSRTVPGQNARSRSIVTAFHDLHHRKLNGIEKNYSKIDLFQRTAQTRAVCLSGEFSNFRVPRRWFIKHAGEGTLGLMAAGGGFTAFPQSLQAKAQSISEAEQILKEVEWPLQWPYTKDNFDRYDETKDTLFYDSPRFVTHIDDSAIRALTKYYESVFPPSNTPGVAILDMCSSWISHYPKGFKQEKVVGLGLNAAELERNEVLTEFVVQDLNENPSLPFEDNSFDVITNAVSVDYLNKPLEVFKEMNRILKPGGLAAMSFSNRCFWTKAVQIWTATDDIDHCYIVGSYFHYAGGFEPPTAYDISPNPGRSDPMYVVFSRKLG